MRQPREGSGPERRRRWVFIALLAPLALAACGSSGDSASTSPSTAGSGGTPSSSTSTPPLEGTAWELTPDGLDVQGLDQIQPTLRLEAGRASGFAGCNTINGSYTLDAPALSFGSMAQTSMACDPAATAIENAYLAALSKVASFTLSSSKLELKDASGATVLTYGTGNTSLAGSWTVTGYLTSSGSAFASVLSGSKLTADFDTAGTVAGSAGCNTYHGPWTLSPSGELAIGPLASTKIACSPDAVAAQETSFLKAMDDSVGAEVGSHQAMFRNQAGQTTVELTR